MASLTQRFYMCKSGVCSQCHHVHSPTNRANRLFVKRRGRVKNLQGDFLFSMFLVIIFPLESSASSLILFSLCLCGSLWCCVFFSSQVSAVLAYQPCSTIIDRHGPDVTITVQKITEIMILLCSYDVRAGMDSA